jgi:hypothetical protein
MSYRYNHFKRISLVASGIVTMFAGGLCSAQDLFYSEGVPAGVLGERPGLTLGRWNFHGGVDTSVFYNDNVRLRAGGREDDFIFSVSPNVLAQIEGPYERRLGLIYRPNFFFFVDHSDQNSVNHAGNVNVRWPMNRLTLGLAQSVSIGEFGLAETLSMRSFRPEQASFFRRQITAPGAGLVEEEAEEVLEARDVGDRLSRKTYGTRFTANYELGHRTSLAGNFGYRRSDYGGNLIGSQQWSQELWADYAVSARTTAGAGVRLAQLDVRQADLQISERPALRLSYTVTDRLGVSAFAGAEWRQFEGGSSGPKAVFGARGNYQVRETTALTLAASRSERSSARLANQNYVQTVISGGLSQALPFGLAAGINGGYVTADYRSVGPGVVTNREDEGYFAGANLGWAATDYLYFGAFYQHFTNTSRSRSGGLPQSFDFDQNIVGIQASWAF